MCDCANVRCVYYCSFSFSFGLICPLNLRILRESAVLMICKCSLFLSLNKITVFPLSFPVVLVDFFWDFNALLFFLVIDLAVVGFDMRSDKIFCPNL